MDSAVFDDDNLVSCAGLVPVMKQARYPREVELMAREYIAISTGTPIDQVAVNWRRRTL